MYQTCKRLTCVIRTCTQHTKYTLETYTTDVYMYVIFYCFVRDTITVRVRGKVSLGILHTASTGTVYDLFTVYVL